MGHWKDKYVIGLTGNIATGKSLVRTMLQHLGAYTIDADGLAHQVMAPNAPAYRPTIEWFGKWIVDKEGRIDRIKLGAVAFSHPEALQRLEAITHPIIGNAINTLITRAPQKVVVVEAIKLLEGELAKQVDAIWVVDSTEENQLQRLMSKRGMSELEGRKRIKTQNPQSEKLAVAQVVIQNNATPNDTWAQVQAAWNKIQGSAEETRQAQEKSTTVATVEIGEVKIKRPKPSDMNALAELINEATASKMTPATLMESLLQASYIVAESNNKMVGTVGFVVENLITQSSQIILKPGVPLAPVLKALINAMEEASTLLQSEVAFVFLKESQDAPIIALLKSELGYEIIGSIQDIKFPAWREAVRGAQPEGTIILSKKLREERVLTPI